MVIKEYSVYSFTLSFLLWGIFHTLSCFMLSLNCFWFILSWQLGIFFYCVLVFRYITALLFHLIPLSFIHALFCLSLSTQLFLCTCFIGLSHISKISCDLEFLPPMFSKHFLSYFIIALKVVVIISMYSPGVPNFHWLLLEWISRFVKV